MAYDIIQPPNYDGDIRPSFDFELEKMRKGRSFLKPYQKAIAFEESSKMLEEIKELESYSGSLVNFKINVVYDRLIRKDEKDFEKRDTLVSKIIPYVLKNVYLTNNEWTDFRPLLSFFRVKSRFEEDLLIPLFYYYTNFREDFKLNEDFNYSVKSLYDGDLKLLDIYPLSTTLVDDGVKEWIRGDKGLFEYPCLRKLNCFYDKESYAIKGEIDNLLRNCYPLFSCKEK